MLRSWPLVLILCLLMVACGQSQGPAAPSTQVPPASGTQTGTTAVPSAYPLPTSGVSATPAAYPGPAAEATQTPEAYPVPGMPEELPSATTGAESYPAPGVSGGQQDVIQSADGVIVAGEYPHQLKIEAVTLYWRNDSQYLYLAAEASTYGWLAVAIDPDDESGEADCIIAADRDGAPALYDGFGAVTVGAMLAQDTQLGGTADLVASGVSLQGGVLRFEAQRALDTGDPYDRPLVPGAVSAVVVATGTGFSLEAPCDWQAPGEIRLD